MKQLKTSHNGGFPFTLDNLRYVEESFRELAAMQVLSELPSNTTKCILSGVEISSPLQDGDIVNSAGVIFYEGEIYEVDELNIAINAINACFILEENLSFAVVFQNGDNRMVHADRKLKLVEANHPDSLFLLSDIELREVLARDKQYPKGWINHVQLTDVSSHFDALGVGFSDDWRGWKISEEAKGRTIVGYDSSDSDYNNVDGTKTGGENSIVINKNNLPDYDLDVSDHRHESSGLINTLDGNIILKKYNNTEDSLDRFFVGNNLTTDRADVEVNSGGSGDFLDIRQPYVVFLTIIKI